MYKEKYSHFSAFFIFSFFIFSLLWFTIGLVGLILYTLNKSGITNEVIFKNPYISVTGLFIIISVTISAIVIAIGSKIMFKVVQKTLNAMKQLAEGDFDVRIQVSGLFRMKELVDFAEQFNTTAKELGSIEMLRSDFVNNFSHEFKTPIASLKGFATLLKTGNLSVEERNEYLDIILSEADRLSALATNILNLNKIENQNIIAEKSRFNLSEHIRRIILLLEPKWSEKSLSLDLDIEEDVFYYGNAEILSQVWLNILDNAIKFSSRNSSLALTLIARFDSIVFKVQDFGCGMTEETQLHIFDKFYQGDQSHTTEGNGLGMAVAKKVVSLHKGKILVDSKLSCGTTVSVLLSKTE